MDSTRRDFLAVAAAVPLAFGLPLPTSAQDAPPQWLPEALDKLRNEDRLGLALRLPKEPERRCWLGHLLADLVDSGDTLTRETLSGVIILCLEEEVFTDRFPENPEDFGVFLLDSDGLPFDGRRRIANPYEELRPAFRAFVEGANGDRFRARAYAACARADEATRELVARLRSAEDLRMLAPKVGELVPWLVSERRNAGVDAGRAARLEESIRSWYEKLPQADCGIRLPYGIQVRPFCCVNHPCCEERSPELIPCDSPVRILGVRARWFVKFG